MIYKILTTSNFEIEFQKIFYYINFNLKEPLVARKFYSKIISSITSLNYFPERYPKFSDFKNHDSNIRKLIVDKYIIIYQVKNDSRQIFILHIFHCSQNYLSLF